ncbi:nose resistant to fluoxetine protein 6-like isoform X1 [Dinothrombium tinctorium]|uniref:Nose resistant to fluoxetine protein 6-like isoform X1 n=1 Tax=Dinothrombium tinctorium TaxID=1965070 RepID=A0A443RHM6_9ACAR|nr:nose resistant to fluoxetine protein 6-like isoform X1 [Dinothrombium tinctorium]
MGFQVCVFIDSSGKIPNGFMQGAVTDYGDYHQCLDIKIPRERSSHEVSEVVSGKYCLTQITRITRSNSSQDASQKNSMRKNSATIRLGICVPSSCKPIEIQIILDKILKSSKLKTKISSRCYTQSKTWNLNYNQKLALIVCSVLILLVSIATAIEKRNHSLASSGFYTQDCLMIKVLRAWSLNSAYSKIFNYKSKRDELLTLHGIRVLTILWMLICNTYLFGIHTNTIWTLSSLLSLSEFTKKLFAQPLLNVWILADSFFFLSGLLIVYVEIPLFSTENGKINFIRCLFHRALRLWSPIIGFFVLKWVFSIALKGPFLLDEDVNEIIGDKCENIFNNLLFVSNWMHSPLTCLNNFWFVSVEMQIYVGIYMVVIVLYHHPKAGLCLNGLILFISIVSSAFVAYYYKLKPSILRTNMDQSEYLQHLSLIQHATFQHLCSSSVGVFTGFLLLNKPFLLKNTNKVVIALLWMLFSSFNAVVVFGTYFWNNDYKMTLTYSVLYGSLHRVFWCLGLSWISYACVTRHGGVNVVNCRLDKTCDQNTSTEAMTEVREYNNNNNNGGEKQESDNSPITTPTSIVFKV